MGKTKSIEVPPRRRGRPGHDVSTVLSGSVAVFNERGYDGTSMEDLADRLGVGKSAIYHHVSGKQALLELALDKALTGLEHAAAHALEQDGTAAERLQQLIRSSVEVLVAELPYVTLLLRVRGNSDVERQALSRRRGIDRVVSNLVKEAVGDGALRPDIDPAVIARLLFGTVNSLVEWLKPGHPESAAGLGAVVTTFVLEGLRPRS